MKLLSFRFDGKIGFGPKVKKEDAVWDVNHIQRELNVLPSFPTTILEGIEKGFDFVEQVRKLTEAAKKADNPERFKILFTDLNWLSPIPRTPKNVLCIGKNYAEHVKEMGAEKPPEKVVVFTKSPTAIAAHEQVLSVHNDVTSSLDYEGELALVICKAGRNIPINLAYDHVFGYTIANDVTARDIQTGHQQYFLGKSLEDSCPMGPYLVTKDEIPNPHELSIVTKVNGEVRQNGHTRDMIYKVDELIAEISKYVTLEVGDVILTGTPAGVGKGMNPPVFLKSNDTVKVSIEGIGTLVNTFE